MKPMGDERKAPSAGDSFEDYPLSRPEYISAMVHFYRGEMHRSQVWRTRLDTTTNWSVVTVAGVISFAFSNPDHSPFVVLLANLLITIFLIVEARRYRYFAVYRARVRMIEENFYVPLLKRDDLSSPMLDWRQTVARDLDSPKFKTTFAEALLFRLKQNYVFLYGFVLITWLVKMTIHPWPARTGTELLERMRLGAIPPGLILAFVALIYGLVAAPLFSETARSAGADEITGQEKDRRQWKL
jgi:uncharacterized membrane protein